MKALTSLLGYDVNRDLKNNERAAVDGKLDEENVNPDLSVEDPGEALEILRLQEAAKLAADHGAGESTFKRNDKLSHVAHASLNFTQFIVAGSGVAFYYVHLSINKKQRLQDPTIPAVPEDRNLVVFLIPSCMLISLLMCVLWCANIMAKRISTAIAINAVGAICMLLRGLAAMRHAEVNINLNVVTDEEESIHPVFIHDYVLCLVSMTTMMLFLVAVYLLNDERMYRKKNQATSKTPDDKVDEITTYRRKCHCRCAHRDACRTRRVNTHHFERSGSIELNDRRRGSQMGSIPAVEPNQEDLINGPPIVYCCCVDWWRYMRHSCCRQEVHMHEFQVIQIM